MKKTGRKNGRPPVYNEDEINNALKLLETHSYSTVTQITGISKSTLIRAKRGVIKMYDTIIQNKFNIGDYVYAIEASEDFINETICPVCNGTHKININGYEFPCVYCERDDYCRHTPIALQIIDIISPTFIVKEFRYNLKLDNYTLEYFSESQLFLTLEEAKAECDRINAELLEKIKFK